MTTKRNKLKVNVLGLDGGLSSRQIERVLGSGALDGFTPGLARKIVELRGCKAIQAIAEWDMEIKAVLAERWKTASDEILEHSESVGLINWLLECGFSGTMARKSMIWRNHESEWTTPQYALSAWKKDPYLLSEIPGIVFERADRIALELGVDPIGEDRQQACAREALRISCDNAGGGAKLSDAMAQVRKLLSMNNAMTPRQAGEASQACFELAQKNGFAKVAKDEAGNPLLFSSELYESEEQAAHLMLGMIGQPNVLEKGNLQERIEELEQKTGLILHDEQRAALAIMFEGKISIVCGKPGSGKTTLLKCAAPLLEAGGKKVLYAAPTGKAAKRMSQSLGRPSSTLHRLLAVGMGGKKGSKAKPKADATQGDLKIPNLKDADAIVLDETSMLDSKMFLRLLRSIGPKTALILLGDPQQLPSVGAGKVLRDLIDSKTLPTAIMTKVMRQSAGSSITSVARAIGEGIWVDFRDKNSDCILLDAPRAEEIAPRIAKMLLGAASGKYDPLKDVQVLAAGNVGPAGVHALNTQLQALLNPPDHNKEESLVKEGMILRKGDKVMQLSNDYERILSPYVALAGKMSDADKKKAMEVDLLSEEGVVSKKGVFNGDVGYIESIKPFPAPGKIIVRYDDGIAEYSMKEAASSLTLSYACTVHKFQGSEAPLIFFIMHESTSNMLRNRNLVYTAITRAKSKCLVMGSEHVLRQATQRDALAGRVTRLKGLLDGSITVDETASSKVLALSEKQGFTRMVHDKAGDLLADQIQGQTDFELVDGEQKAVLAFPQRKKRSKFL